MRKPRKRVPLKPHRIFPVFEKTPTTAGYVDAYYRANKNLVQFK